MATAVAFSLTVMELWLLVIIFSLVGPYICQYVLGVFYVDRETFYYCGEDWWCKVEDFEYNKSPTLHVHPKHSQQTFRKNCKKMKKKKQFQYKVYNDLEKI